MFEELNFALDFAISFDLCVNNLFYSSVHEIAKCADFTIKHNFTKQIEFCVCIIV